MADGDGLKAAVVDHFKKLVGDCPASTILVAQLVLVEGATHVVVAVNQQVTEGGPCPDVLRSKLAEVARDYLRLCPLVAWVEPSGKTSS